MYHDCIKNLGEVARSRKYINSRTDRIATGCMYTKRIIADSVKKKKKILNLLASSCRMIRIKNKLLLRAVFHPLVSQFARSIHLIQEIYISKRNFNTEVIKSVYLRALNRHPVFPVSAVLPRKTTAHLIPRLRRVT